MADPLKLFAPAVMSVRGSVLGDAEPLTEWTVGYAPEVDDDGGRFVMTRLYVSEGDISVEVELAATQMGGDFDDLDDDVEARRFELALDGSASLDLLWDMSRIVAKAVLGTLEEGAFIPLAPPVPEFTRLVRSGAENVESS